MEDGGFDQQFTDQEERYHSYDSGDRPLIRAETDGHVLGALLDGRTRIVLVEDFESAGRGGRWEAS
jgi:hypothetical protein